MLSCRGKAYQNMNVHTLMRHKHKELKIFKTSYQEARKTLIWNIFNVVIYDLELPSYNLITQMISPWKEFKIPP
jgi:hypothetical protein